MNIEADRPPRPTLPRAVAWGLIAALAFAAWRLFVDPSAAFHRAESAQDARAAPSRRAELARAAIHAAPLDGRPYRFLAEALLAQRRPADASGLFEVAAARGPRDLPSQTWLANQALAHGDFPAALARIDIILRVQPQLGPKIYPVMAALALRAQEQPAVASVLAKQPPWRPTFMQNLLRSAPDSAAIFGLVELLRHAPPGLSNDELGWWLDRLIAEHQWSTAYLTWAASLDPTERDHIGNVFNGSFELEPSQQGFGWRFGRPPGARISREQVTGATGSLALRIAFEDRRVPFRDVRELLALSPGDYRFTGRSRLDQLRTERGLVWSLSCAEDNRPIAETQPFAGNHAWRDFEQQVTVPAANCAAQWLTLLLPARIPAEQRIGGTAWFDGLEMERVSPDQRPGARS